MIRINQIAFFIFYTIAFYSCKAQSKDKNCNEMFYKARELAFSNQVHQSALDSALYLINESMQCDDIRKAAVELKITLLVRIERYSEGIGFIDSLKESDFTFGYKKNFMAKALRALEYNSIKDTIRRDLVYKELASDIEQYIQNENINEKEFLEVYTDLFTVKENYLDTIQINKEVEALKNKYPDKQSFFDFFKK